MTALSGYAQVQQDAPDQLVERHAPLVKRIALHVRSRLPDGIELDDLVQVGLIALLEAARAYAPDKGASFETYAGIRIRGAMLDEVRRTDWIPRSVYRQQRQLGTAIAAVESRTGASASSEDIASELGVSLDEYFRMASAAAAPQVLSLDERDEDGRGDWREQLPDESGDPGEQVESDQFRAGLAQAIAALPEREALVMSLYYDEELNLKEIGAVLGVSESRVCQLHGQALSRLRSRMSAPARAGRSAA
jgi:RNA polymerase sigma factor FliA